MASRPTSSTLSAAKAAECGMTAFGRRAFGAVVAGGVFAVSRGESGRRLALRGPRLRRRRAGAAASCGTGAWWWSTSRGLRCGVAVGASACAVATATDEEESASGRFGSFDLRLKNSRGIRFLSRTVSTCASPAAVPRRVWRLEWVARDDGYQSSKSDR